MNKTMKQLLLIVVIGGLLLHPQTLFASPNVIDCMNNEADCAEQQEEQVPNIDEEETNDTLLTGESSDSSLVLELVKLFFALLLVLGLIYGLVKFLQKRSKLFNQVKALENLGGISVGQNKSIQIIRIGSRLYIVGVGDNVEMLQEVTDEDMIEEILRKPEQADAKEFPGASLVNAVTKKSSTGSKQPDFKRLYGRELESLKNNRKKMMDKHKEDSHE